MNNKVQAGRSRVQEEMAKPTWTTKAKPWPFPGQVKESESTRGRVQKVEAAPVEKRKLRVAAYCRVSTDMAEQETSIDAQRIHYVRYIESNPEWTLADIYWEQGVSGTKADTRPELQRLLADCEKGVVDMVITKSISRFSRNTADCLEMVRKLGSLGVRIVFEKEGIDTGKMESEFLLTLLSAFAENESRSLSSNMKWGIRKRFEAGTYKAPRAPYGYEKTEEGPDGKIGYVINPVESEIVRRIFYSLLDGKGSEVVARELNEEGVPSPSGALADVRDVNDTGGEEPAEQEEGKWLAESIRKIIKNSFYVGDLTYQKTYMDDSFRQRENKGEVDMYFYQDDHPPIISREIFELANKEMARRAALYSPGEANRNRYCFSGKVICGGCGSKMYRGGSNAKPYFLCHGHKFGECPMASQYEDDVKSAFATVLNKLAWGEANGVPVLKGFADAGDVEERASIREAMEAVERRQAVLHDRVMAERFTAELRAKKAALDSEMVGLKARLEKLGSRGDVYELRRAVMERGIKPRFTGPDQQEDEVLSTIGVKTKGPGGTDADIFAAHVDKAVVWSRDRVEFHFTCGLVLTESLKPGGKEA